MGLFVYFALPTGYFASTTALLLGLSTDLKDLIILGLGIAIAFWVLPKMIDLIKYGAK
jgi:hypothetical protein